MTRVITHKLTLLMFALMACTAISAAQNLHLVKASIPFAFTVGKKTFPAGEYTLLRPEQHLLTLRDAGGRTVAQILTQAVDSRNEAEIPKLRFELVDGQYKLAEVSEPRSDGERLFPASRPQSKMARQNPAPDPGAGEEGQP